VKILVLRFSSLGDIIMSTAMIRCLRQGYPDAQIDMVVRADFFDLISENPHLTNKWSLGRGEGLKGLRALVKRINHEEYDLIYDAHRSLRTLLMMPFLKAKAKAYYEKHYLRRALALTFKLPLLSKRRMLERFIDPLAPWEISYDGGGPEMVVAPDAKARAQQKVPIDLNRRWIGVVPSAQWPGKRWPLPYFRTLIESIVSRTDRNVLIFGGKADTFCAELIAGLPADRVVSSQGKLSIAESAAHLTRCELVVANDTGLMHVADALNIPSVLFLGPTSAEMGCLPFHPKARVLEETLWCRPCSKNGQAPCIRGKRLCLEQITPDRALAATLELIRETSA
jgi:lipopolysaccharide heptosyltransferase II